MAELDARRMSRRVVRPVMMTLALGWPVSIACTGDEAVPPTAAAYFADGDAICLAAIEERSELDFRSSQSEEELDQAAIDLGVLHRDASRALLALRPPPELEADHANLVAIYDRFDDAVQALAPMREIQERGQAFDDAVAAMDFEYCG